MQDTDGKRRAGGRPATGGRLTPRESDYHGVLRLRSGGFAMTDGGSELMADGCRLPAASCQPPASSRIITAWERPP
jgi:hypothetical protein